MFFTNSFLKSIPNIFKITFCSVAFFLVFAVILNSSRTADLAVNATPSSGIVIIDAGHGGEDSGAIGKQTAIRIGDVAFVGHPFETFSEIGLRINVMSKIPHVLSIAMANGNECYLPTVGEIPRGGYEVRMFKSHALQPYTNDVDYSLITESVKTLEELI